MLCLLHRIANVQKLLCINPVAKESAGKKPDGSRNVCLNHQLHTESDVVAITLNL